MIFRRVAARSISMCETPPPANFFFLEERTGVLLAPNWAIRKDKKAGKSYLTVPAGDNKTTDLEVVTGLKDDTFIEIISGAAEGQAIVAPEGSQP